MYPAPLGHHTWRPYKDGFPHMSEKKWRANADKVAFAKAFPGRLTEWGSAVGKKIERIIAVEEQPAGMVIFSDGDFIFIPSPDPEPPYHTQGHDLRRNSPAAAFALCPVVASAQEAPRRDDPIRVRGTR